MDNYNIKIEGCYVGLFKGNQPIGLFLMEEFDGENPEIGHPLIVNSIRRFEERLYSSALLEEASLRSFEFGENERVFENYILDKGEKLIRTEWIQWMLKILRESNIRKILINPVYLNGLHRKFQDDDEPPMI